MKSLTNTYKNLLKPIFNDSDKVYTMHLFRGRNIRSRNASGHHRGGITGLSAAWEAQQRGIACTLLEASDRWGGKVISSELGMTGSRFIVDLMRLATGNALVAYSTLFGMEAVTLVVALYLTTRLDMGASQASAEERDLVSVAASAD